MGRTIPNFRRSFSIKLLNSYMQEGEKYEVTGDFYEKSSVKDLCLRISKRTYEENVLKFQNVCNLYNSCYS